MRKKAELLLLIGCLAFLGVGCTATQVVETPAPDAELVTVEPELPTEDIPTELPTATAMVAPSPTPRTILWEDDFSDFTSGWERYREFDGILDYVEGEAVYQMQVQAEDNLWWVYLPETMPEAIFSIETWQVGGPEGSLFGVMCRYDPDSLDGVVFLISTEGQAGVGTINNGFDPLPGGELAHFDVIQTGMNARNTLEAGCVGEALTMTVNGEVLFELPVPESIGEFIGLAVATPLGAGADVYFDNLIVYQP